jgi:hypothetical protein
MEVEEWKKETSVAWRSPCVGSIALRPTLTSSLPLSVFKEQLLIFFPINEIALSQYFFDGM